MNKQNIDGFKHFIKICDDNHIKYFVFYGTLLGAIRHKGPIPGDDDFDVVMSVASYEKLKALYPDHCIDTTTRKEFPLLTQKFVPTINNYLKSPIFVDIFLIIPSTQKHMNTFTRRKNKYNYVIQTFKSPLRFDRGLFILLKYISIPLWLFSKKLTYKNCNAMLESPKKELDFILNPFMVPTKETIFSDISFKIIQKPFLDFKVNVPKDFHKILSNIYGDYMVPIDYGISHTNALSTVKKRT